jgi:hypothetical protein
MTDETKPNASPIDEGKPLNRRRILKVAIATAPVIATLPSGAALARSSNLIGPTSGSGRDSQNRLLCLDLRSGANTNGMVDLGTPPRGLVNAIKERDYRVGAQASASTISEAQMCKQGGAYYYQSSAWHQVNVPKGIVVSATALSSFAGGIYFNEI